MMELIREAQFTRSMHVYLRPTLKRTLIINNRSPTAAVRTMSIIMAKVRERTSV